MYVIETGEINEPIFEKGAEIERKDIDWSRKR